ncbi:MAG: type II secretion system F family protein [Candidatus Magasanikbacteria bacterium]|jgi:type IV pilus assembly protein PilC|nr:type II secretion system F family protein [Candidatus Magasanikbacteria bacterium]
MKKKEKALSPLEIKMNAWVTAHLSRIPFVQKIFFIEHLRTMVHAGISLVEALSILEKELENKKLRLLVGKIKTEVEQGTQLSEALETYEEVFPHTYIKMVAAGELSGKLEESLLQIETQMKKTHELTSTIRGAMIYPSVILTAMLGVGVFMVIFVLPKLTELFKEFDAELPLATKILIGITDFLSNPIYLTAIIITVIGFIFLFITLLKKQIGFQRAVHRMNLHIPIFGGVIKQINLARFSLTLSSLLKSAIPITEAISITAETCTNVLYKEALLGATNKIQSGIPLSEILTESPKLFPPIVTEMVMVGERSGEVDQLLSELSDFYGTAVDKTMKNFTTIIEPVIILTLGLAVGGMAVAVIMPMYSLMQNF